jgi:hypothetical protein
MSVVMGHDAIGWSYSQHYARLRIIGGEKERGSCYAQFEDVSL